MVRTQIYLTETERTALNDLATTTGKSQTKLALRTGNRLMRFFDHSKPCPHCGEAIKLRSFRPPATWCPHCDKPLDPDAPDRPFGCLACLVLCMGAGALPGYVGFLLGGLLGEAINDPLMPFRLAFLAGSDSLCFACLYFSVGWRSKTVQSPISVFLIFTVIGIKCTIDLGLAGGCICGITNGVFGTVVAMLMLPPQDGKRQNQLPGFK